MPAELRPLSQKQLDFCEIYIAEGNATKAYRMVYAQSDDTKSATCVRGGKQMLKNYRIRAHIERLREMNRKRLGITINTITEQLLHAYDMAVDQQNTGSMIRASTDLAKLHGLVVEKREVTVTNLDRLTEAELAAVAHDQDELLRMAKERREALAAGTVH